jgi:hypothetical protein
MSNGKTVKQYVPFSIYNSHTVMTGKMNLNGMAKNDDKGTYRTAVLFNYFYCNPTPPNRTETYATECSTYIVIIRF